MNSLLIPCFLKSLSAIQVALASGVSFHFIRFYLYSLFLVLFFTLESSILSTCGCLFSSTCSSATSLFSPTLYYTSSISRPLYGIKSLTLKIGEIDMSLSKSILYALNHTSLIPYMVRFSSSTVSLGCPFVVWIFLRTPSPSLLLEIVALSFLHLSSPSNFYLPPLRLVSPNHVFP